MLDLASGVLSVIGRASTQRYVLGLLASAPVVAIAGLVFVVASLRWRDDRRSRTLTFAGGGLSLLALVGYIYAHLAQAGGNQ